LWCFVEQAYLQLRVLWSEEQNCILMGTVGVCELRAPGGFGACGAPNDQWHNNFHALRRCYASASLGWNRNPMFSKPIEEMQFQTDGSVYQTMSLEDSLKSDVFALDAIRNHRSGNIIMRAWLRTGHVSEQQLADWKFNGNRKLLAEEMVALEGSMSHLYQLTSLPDLNLVAQWSEEKKPLTGESVHVWFVDRGAAGVAALPIWANLAIELKMSEWVAEARKWEKDIAERVAEGACTHTFFYVRM
jgi:hypothetical protein